MNAGLGRWSAGWRGEWTVGERLAVAAAVWAGLLLLASIGGFGSRFTPLSAGASAAPALPQLPAASRDASLQDFSAYAEIGQRPLLMADRRPAAVALLGKDDGASAAIEAVLTSVMIAGDFRMAILTDTRNGQAYRVKLGEVAEGTGLRLVQLEPRRAVFEGSGGQQTYELRVFDGQGGQAPTASVAPQSIPANAAPVNAASPGPVPAAVANASGDTAPSAMTPEQTQQQQIEAIRKRIEARRAQMRAEAERQRSQKVQ